MDTPRSEAMVRLLSIMTPDNSYKPCALRALALSAILHAFTICIMPWLK